MAIKKVVGAAAVIFAACALYNGLTLRQYSLASPKIKEPVTLVLVSDLHNTLHGKDQRNLVGMIKEQRPDLILIAGDILDSVNKIENVMPFLDGVRDICPVYYVPGNHEYRTRRMDVVREIIEAGGAKFLADSTDVVEVKGNRIIIAGADDPARQYYGDIYYSQKASMRKAFSELADMAEYKILLSHRPERIGNYLPYSFDLVLAGHAHGGQVRVPFLLNGLYSPDQGFFPKLAGGRYDFDGTTMVVSRGASFYWRFPRVFNPPEVVSIKLYKE